MTNSSPMPNNSHDEINHSLTEESVAEPPEVPPPPPERTRSSPSIGSDRERNSSVVSISNSSGHSQQSSSDQSIKKQNRVRFTEHQNLQRENFVLKADAAVNRSLIHNSSLRGQQDQVRPGTAVFMHNSSPTTDNVPQQQEEGVDIFVQRRPTLSGSQSEITMSTLSTMSIQSRVRQNRIAMVNESENTRSRENEFQSEFTPQESKLGTIESTGGDEYQPEMEAFNQRLRSLPHIAVATVVEDDENQTPRKFKSVKLSVYAFALLVCGVAIISGILVALLMKNGNNASTSTSAISKPSYLTYVTMDTFALIFIASENSIANKPKILNTTLNHLNEFFSRSFNGFQSLNLNIEISQGQHFYRRRLEVVEKVTATFSGMASFEDNEGTSLIDANAMESVVINAFSGENAEKYLVTMKGSTFEPIGLGLFNENGSMLSLSTGYDQFLKDKEGRTPSMPSTPTNTPMLAPVDIPTVAPTNSPTNKPTLTDVTETTETPTPAPVNKVTPIPSQDPSKTPTKDDSLAPTSNPSNASSKPSRVPSYLPSYSPSKIPSKFPSKSPSKSPSKFPTTAPTTAPTSIPSKLSMRPSVGPTEQPSHAPPFFLQTNRRNARKSSSGSMFNIVTKSSGVLITGIDIEMNFKWNWTKIFVYTRDGSYEGHENDDDGWTLDGGSFYRIERANGLDSFTPIPKLTPISIPPNTVKGFYVTIPAGFGVVMGRNMTIASDEFLDIVPGISKGYPFNWTNDNYSFSGGFHYKVQ